MWQPTGVNERFIYPLDGTICCYHRLNNGPRLPRRHNSLTTLRRNCRQNNSEHKVSKEKQLLKCINYNFACCFVLGVKLGLLYVIKNIAVNLMFMVPYILVVYMFNYTSN
jgi:hypothetical protein